MKNHLIKILLWTGVMLTATNMAHALPGYLRANPPCNPEKQCCNQDDDPIPPEPIRPGNWPEGVLFVYGACDIIVCTPGDDGDCYPDECDPAVECCDNHWLPVGCGNFKNPEPDPSPTPTPVPTEPPQDTPGDDPTPDQPKEIGEFTAFFEGSGCSLSSGLGNLDWSLWMAGGLAVMIQAMLSRRRK